MPITLRSSVPDVECEFCPPNLPPADEVEGKRAEIEAALVALREGRAEPRVLLKLCYEHSITFEIWAAMWADEQEREGQHP